MRILAGKYKNRALVTPPGVVTRPMLTRIRKSLFDILQPYLDRARVLDLFSGTGAEALEAFSRGASFAISVDSDAVALQTAKDNHQKICPQETYRILRGNVITLLPQIAVQNPPFDVISVTPPYGHGLADATLEIIDNNPRLLHEETVIYAQRGFTEEMKLEWTILEHLRTKKYGKTVMEFFMPKETINLTAMKEDR